MILRCLIALHILDSHTYTIVCCDNTGNSRLHPQIELLVNKNVSVQIFIMKIPISHRMLNYTIMRVYLHL